MTITQFYITKLNGGGRERASEVVIHVFKIGQTSSKQMPFVQQFVRLVCPWKEPLILEER